MLLFIFVFLLLLIIIIFFNNTFILLITLMSLLLQGMPMTPPTGLTTPPESPRGSQVALQLEGMPMTPPTDLTTPPQSPRGSQAWPVPLPAERPPLLFAIMYGALESREHYGKPCLELQPDGIVTKCWEYSVDGSIYTWNNQRPCVDVSVWKEYYQRDGVGMGGHRAAKILITYPEDEDVADVVSLRHPLMSRHPTVVIRDRIDAAVDAIVQDECMILVPRTLFDAMHRAG